MFTFLGFQMLVLFHDRYRWQSYYSCLSTEKKQKTNRVKVWEYINENICREIIALWSRAVQNPAVTAFADVLAWRNPHVHMSPQHWTLWFWHPNHHHFHLFLLTYIWWYYRLFCVISKTFPLPWRPLLQNKQLQKTKILYIMQRKYSLLVSVLSPCWHSALP